MIQWSGFFDFISSDVPGCTQLSMRFALRQSAIAFCEQSLAWRVDHDPVAVITAISKYPFSPPAEAVVHAITYAAFNGKEIKSRESENSIYMADWRNQTGAPQYVLGGATALTIVPKPSSDGVLTMTVALKPSFDAAGIDDSLFDEFREAIVHGALASLMLSPKKPYSDAQLANYHAQLFRIKTGQAGVRVAKNYTRAPLTTEIMRRR